MGPSKDGSTVGMGPGTAGKVGERFTVGGGGAP